MSIRYPLDLGHKVENDFPYVTFDIVQYRDRNWIVDSGPASSGEVSKHWDTYVNEDVKTIYLDTIHLPLPDNVQNGYAPNWEMTDLRIIEGIRDVLQASGMSEIATIAGGAVLSVTVGDMMKKIAAKTPNPKKQAIFNGIEARGFSFNWTFIPYSQQEAETIDNIIKTFTMHSLPNLEKPSDAFYDFPAEFGITFNNVKGFPKLSYCVCVGVNVGYSQSNTQIMSDGYATQTTLSLSFLETDLRTKTRPGI